MDKRSAYPPYRDHFYIIFGILIVQLFSIILLRAATVTHKQWVKNAQDLIEGELTDTSKVPLASHECEFGKWYFTEGQKLKGIKLFNDIDPIHEKLHKIYGKIYQVLTEKQKKKSIVAKLLRRSEKIDPQEREVVMAEYQLLKKQSEIIIRQLEQLEKTLLAMHEKQLANYLSLDSQE